MNRWDRLEARDALRALSLPAAADRASMTRRRFLQATLATAGATAVLPSWLADAAAATTPIGAHDGVLVIVLMAGGNDGLSTVIPTGDSAYYKARGPIAITGTSALPLASGVGLHPNLVKLQARYLAGQVAVLRGVGDMDPDMSHFTAMARWMAGQTSTTTTASTGWIGRWLDGYAKADDLSSVVIGDTVPLALVGANRKATALPATGDDAITGDHTEGWVKRSLDCLRDFGAGPTGSGALADALGGATRGAVDLGDVVKPLYATKLPDGKLVPSLELCARVINANLGTHVLQVQYGDFDSHANEPSMHDARMAELDDGIERFFATLSPAFAKRTTIMTMSEFGRRLEANASNGTDHGEASDIFAVGAGVKGGIYGEASDLSHLSDHGCPMAMVDFRDVYATFLDRWLGADSKQVLGGSYQDLGFLSTPSK